MCAADDKEAGYAFGSNPPYGLRTSAPQRSRAIVARLTPYKRRQVVGDFASSQASPCFDLLLIQLFLAAHFCAAPGKLSDLREWAC